MKTNTVLIARIYIMESSHLLEKILEYLRNDVHILGVSVFRAISGFGNHEEHSVALMALSLDLPLAIEFFDIPSKMQPALEYLNTLIKPEHIIFWEAKANFS